MRQAQAAGRLHHPHIVTVFDAGHVNRIGYLALEKVDGKLLDELLAEGYRPGFLQAADIVARVADAVEFAHARGIPHGHLSPSRIYLQGPERLPKVMGFGGWIDSGSTGDFELHGTERLLPYFGNELSSEARRKDVRALGALLFLLLTGTRPDASVLRTPVKSAESPVLQLKPTAPLALAEIAEQALELGGTRVFANAGQVRNALTTFLWGNRGDMPLPNSATITGMPARIAVMPKKPTTLTVATLAAIPARTEPARGRSAWRTHIVAGAVGVVAIAVISGIALRAPTETKRAAPSPPPTASSAAVTGVRFAPLSPAETAGGANVPTRQSEHASAVAGQSTERAEAARNSQARHSAGTSATAPAPGIVALAVAPWGMVYVNGEARGTTPPLTQLTLPAGRYLIEIRNGEQAPYVAQVDVSADQPQQLRHRFQ